MTELKNLWLWQTQEAAEHTKNILFIYNGGLICPPFLFSFINLLNVYNFFYLLSYYVLL